MTASLVVQIDGTPRPQGSLTPWVSRRTGKVHVSHAGGVPAQRWRALIAAQAGEAWASRPIAGPVGVRMLFRLPFRAGNTNHGYHVNPPDVDKLARLVLDALTGVVYRDDAQVVDMHASKVYAVAPHSVPGVVITLYDWHADDDAEAGAYSWVASGKG